TFEYLLILINQAAIAYENSCLFEEESKRTLGLVQSLISLIEENTLSRGNTETTVNYTYAVAKNMHYPEENVRDLIYGTVLRDIGMIKVSDLIVRSPRELQEGEWEIIKRHPIEGAEMLRRMKFSEHTTNVVLCHHERFNGQGYPNQMQGPQIPLGARIVSVVESYTAMLQDRPTRPALSDQEALNTLKENWGMRYDPDIVAQFVDIVEEEIRTGRLVKYQGSELFRD
ncbi:MAG: HD domain-containing protein, partial [Candidatus Krumholzibacteria bacterium]|nr:HD domain-containing protein [Candidatus Krumholzibacteria bacterium]